MVAARPPLVAFNVELAPPADLVTARRIAALIRQGGAEGLTGVRAIAISLASRNHSPQVSTNVENHRATLLADIVAAISRHATPARAELVGLAPASAFDRFPAGLEVANRRTIEDALQLSVTASPPTD
jgi:glutamate formiminotransferase